MKLSEIPPHVTEVEGHPESFWTAYKAAYGEWPDGEEIKPLWSLNYYDGPLSGIVACRGRHFYVKALYFDDRCWWAAWALTDEEWERTLARHKAFEEHVGLHTNYYEDDNGNLKRDVGTVKPQEEWDKFYKNPDIPEVGFGGIETDREIFAVLRNPFRNW